MNDLVKIVDNTPLVSTLDIWEPLKVEHPYIVNLIQKYETDFQDIRVFRFENRKPASISRFQIGKLKKEGRRARPRASALKTIGQGV